MRTIQTTVKTEKNKPFNRPIHLYTLYDFDGAGHNLNYAAYDQDVSFNSITFAKFPISHESVSENSSGQIDSVKIKVANVNRLIQGYLDQWNLRGKKVDIITVFADQLSNPLYKTIDTFYIDSYTADQNIVEFTLSSKFDVLDVNIPSRKFLRNFCQWKFKGVECGYGGAETSCTKIKNDCETVKNNLVRFGGFPSIPQQRTYVQ